jgi:hypothetical protein
MQPTPFFVLFLGALAPLASLCAQSSLVLPSEYDLAWGRGSAAGLGSNTTRTQHIFANPFPVGTVVLGVGFRPTASSIDRAAFTAEIEIQISSTTATPGALNTNFASNIGSDVMVVFPRQLVTIPAMPANRGTGTFFEVFFTTPFVYGTNAATNINVDLFVYSRSTGASWSTDRAFASANGRASTAGIGCGAATINSTSLTPAYVAGSQMTITLANAPANSLALLLPSLNQKFYVPGLNLPIDLQQYGSAAGCNLLVDPSLGPTAFLTDGAGAAASLFTPPTGIGRIGVSWQWLYLVNNTPANVLGLETTASRATWIGPEVVVPGSQYVWNLSSVTGATGTATTDSVPIVKFLLP